LEAKRDGQKTFMDGSKGTTIALQLALLCGHGELGSDGLIFAIAKSKTERTL